MKATKVATDKAMGSEKLLADILRGETGHLRVTVTELDGRLFVGLRVWFHSRKSGLIPDARRGLAIRPSELPDVIAALTQAVRVLQEKAVPEALR